MAAPCAVDSVDHGKRAASVRAAAVMRGAWFDGPTGADTFRCAGCGELLLLTSGAEAARVEDTMRRLARAYGFNNTKRMC